MRKQFIVLGLGSFGASVAVTLQRLAEKKITSGKER